MHPLEQFGRVFWAGFEQLAAAGEAADALEQKRPTEQPQPAPAEAKPAAAKPAASPADRECIDTEGHDL